MAENNRTTSCIEPGCSRKHRAHGLCLMHYKRKWRAAKKPPQILQLPEWATALDVAYAAGFIDADGSIFVRGDKSQTTLSGRRFIARIGAVCVDREPIDFLKKMFGGGSNTRPPRSTNVKARLPIHQWWVDSYRASWVASLIAPYLKIKKPQAEAVIAFKAGPWKQNPHLCNVMPAEELARRQALHDLCRSRNQRHYLLA
jgi:hypothetical protein